MKNDITEARPSGGLAISDPETAPSFSHPSLTEPDPEPDPVRGRTEALIEAKDLVYEETMRQAAEHLRHYIGIAESVISAEAFAGQFEQGSMSELEGNHRLSEMSLIQQAQIMAGLFSSRLKLSQNPTLKDYHLNIESALKVQRQMARTVDLIHKLRREREKTAERYQKALEKEAREQKEIDDEINRKLAKQTNRYFDNAYKDMD